MVSKCYWIYVFLFTVQFCLAENREGRYSEFGAGWRGKFHFKPKENNCFHSQEPDQGFTFYAEAGFWLRTKTWSLSHDDEHFKDHLQKVWVEMGRETCSAALRGKFLWLSGCWSDSSRTSQAENRGIGLLLVVGFGYALCLRIFYLVCLVAFCFVCCFGFFKED